MAVPMVTLTITTLLVPLMMQSLSLLPDWNYINRSAVVLLMLSGLVGTVLGAVIELRRTWSRSMQRSLRFVQDLLAYDFYIDRLYRVSVVLVVERLSKFNSWLDQYVVDGAVNLVGLATIFSGQGLKYIGSGQSQFYIVTILLGISLLTAIFSWPFLQALGFDPFAF